MAKSYEKLTEELEEKNRMLLRMEYWVVLPTIILAIIVAIVVSYVEMLPWLKALLIVFSVAMIIAVACVAVNIEQKAGYYECKHCHNRYVPTYRQVCLAVHSGRTRYMKCPECEKRSWQKKVLTESN